jgi:multidrug efflux pump subunit AcrB
MDKRNKIWVGVVFGLVLPAIGAILILLATGYPFSFTVVVG